jgi:hypothetical protein
MVTCPACKTEVPAESAFCPSCGAAISPQTPVPPAAPGWAPGAATASADLKALLLIGAIGAFTVLLLTILSMVQMFVGMMSQALRIAIAILGLGGLIGLGVGLFGFKRATDNAFAMPAAVALFLAALIALTPLLALAARSRGILELALYGAPIVSLIAWSLCGVAALTARKTLGAGISNLSGYALLASGVWEVVALIMMLSDILRSRSSAQVFLILGILFLLVRMAGVGGLAAAFLRLRRA